MRKKIIGLIVAGGLAVGGFGAVAATASPAPVTSEAMNPITGQGDPLPGQGNHLLKFGGYGIPKKVHLTKKPMRIVGYVSVPKVNLSF